MCSNDSSAPGFSTRERVAVVVDDDSIRGLLCHILIEEGFDVTQLSSTHDVFSSIARDHPSLILVESPLRLQDSQRLCIALRADARTSTIPILTLITAEDSPDPGHSPPPGDRELVRSPFDFRELMLRVKSILGQLPAPNVSPQETRQKDSKPEIIRRIEDSLFSTSDWAMLYVDLHNFRAFNQRHGSAMGDAMIASLGKIIVEAVAQYGEQGDAIGHLGGGSFIIASTTFCADSLARHIIRAFEDVHSSEFISAGGQDSKRSLAPDVGDCALQSPVRADSLADSPPARGRVGPETTSFPSILIGIVTRENTEATKLGEIIETARQVRGLAKGKTGNAYVKDRRVVTFGPPSLH